MELSSDLYASLHKRLVNGHYAYGSRLRAAVLADELRSSASAVREALFRLSTVGLVVFQEQRGFRVPKSDPKLQHELTHLRILLEGEGATLSIRQGGLAWEARLTAAHHKLAHIESRLSPNETDSALIDLWSAAEDEFHQTLIDACGSDTLKREHSIIYQQFRQQLISADKAFQFVPENVIQHQGILNAALDRDEAAVRQRIHDHLSRNLSHPLPKAV